MKNFICINGNKIELTDEQIKALGFTPDRTIAELSEIVRSGKAREHFKVHDTVNIDGREFEIIGFNHDRDADDETIPTVTLMAKTLLPAHRMHSGACERGWIDTELREWLNTEVIGQLSEELVSHIRPVKKTTHNYNGDTYETVDKLYIPSESEMFGSAIWSNYEDGVRYEAFSTSELRVRVDDDGDGDWYWTRSFLGHSTHCTPVGNGGGAGGGSATASAVRAPLCFTFA